MTALRPFCLRSILKANSVRRWPADVPVVSFADHHRSPRINYPGRILTRQGRTLAECAEQQNVHLICDRNWEMTLVAALASRSTSVPRVSIMGSHPARDLEARGGRFRSLKKRLLSKAYRSAARVVAVSEGVRENAIDFFELRPEQVETIHSFVDVEQIDQRSDAYQPALEPHRFHIVAVGRLQSEKGYRFLIEAVSQLVQTAPLERLHLTIIGQGPQQEELETMIQQRQLESHIQLLGYLENPLPYVRHADLYCLPSLYEGMPNALEEAVVCGVPVIASNCPSGPEEILDRGKHGRLVPPGGRRRLGDRPGRCRAKSLELAAKDGSCSAIRRGTILAAGQCSEI